MGVITNDEITRLLQSASLTEDGNLNQLFQQLYLQIKQIATNQLKRSQPDSALSPTVLVNECYLKLSATQGLNVHNRKHFFSIAAKSMRFYLMDILKGYDRQKRKGINTVLCLSQLTDESPLDLEIESLDAALTELELIDDQLARIVELRFFWGFTLHEIGDMFETRPHKIYQQWLTAKSLLLNLIEEQ